MNRNSVRLALFAVATAFSAPAGADTLVCPATSSPTSWSGTGLDFGTLKSGVVYDGSNARLRLENAAGLFKSTALGVTDLTVFASVADFDKDGWDDFVGTGEGHAFVRIYRNRTFDTLP